MEERASSPSEDQPAQELAGQELDRPTAPVPDDFEVTKVIRLDSDVLAQRQEFYKKQNEKKKTSAMQNNHGGIVYRGLGSEAVSEGGKRRRADRKSFHDY